MGRVTPAALVVVSGLLIGGGLGTAVLGRLAAVYGLLSGQAALLVEAAGSGLLLTGLGLLLMLAALAGS